MYLVLGTKGFTPMAQKANVFISYGHADTRWKDLLVRHLRILERENMATVWDTAEIEPGAEWSQAIGDAVQKADAAVVLLSPDFLSSDYITQKELPLLLERRKKEGLVLLPILVSPTAWTYVSGLAEVRFLNDPSKPLSELSDTDRERALSDIASRIVSLVETLRTEQTRTLAAGDDSLSRSPHFFISHSGSDGDFAELLKLRMAEQGYAAWVDTDRLGPGLDWREEIDKAIRQSRALIAVMSVEARGSEYVTYEWAFAWGAGVKIIPIMLKETPLHPRLATLQYLDFTNRTARPWQRLFAALAEAQNGQQ